MSWRENDFTLLKRCLWLCVLMGLAPIAFATQPIKIGYIGGLSGPDISQSAGFAFEAMRLVFDEANAKGGIHGRRIELIPFDNKGLPHENIDAFKRAIQAGVTLLSGVHYSNDGLLLNKLAEQHHLPLVVTTASHPGIVDGRNYVTRVCFSDERQADNLAKLALKLGSRRVSIVTDVRNSFGLYVTSRLKLNFEKAGVEVTEIKVAKGSPQFDSAVRALVNGPKPDSVIFTTQAKDSALLLTELKKRNLKTNYIGTDAWESVDILKILKSLGQSMPIYFVGHWPPNAKDADWLKLSGHIRRRFDVELSPYLCDPILSYDAARLIVKALETCPNLEGASVVSCLKHVQTNGITGSTKIHADGESHKPVFLFRVQGEKVETVKL